MNFLQEAKEILEVIHSLKERRMNRKQFMSQAIERNENRKWSIRESNISHAEQQTQTFQRKGATNQFEKQFRITYLITVIPYLNPKTILDLSSINREFHQFIFSVYFYKFITEIRLSQNPKRLNQQQTKGNTHLKQQQQKQQHQSSSGKKDDSKNLPQAGFFSKITGAFSVLTGGTSELGSKREIDPKEFLEKLNHHERILKEKQKQFALSKEIRDIRDDINKSVDERYEMQMNKVPNQSTSNNNSTSINQSTTIMTDKEIEVIKKEKLEKESEILTKEVDRLKKESDQLKKELEKLQKEDIDSEILLNSLSSYVKNNMDYDSIKEELDKRDPSESMNIDNIIDN